MTLTHNKKYTEKTKKLLIKRGEELMDTSKLYTLSKLPHNNPNEGCELYEIIWDWRCNDR